MIIQESILTVNQVVSAIMCYFSLDLHYSFSQLILESTLNLKLFRDHCQVGYLILKSNYQNHFPFLIISSLMLNVSQTLIT